MPAFNEKPISGGELCGVSRGVVYPEGQSEDSTESLVFLFLMF